MTGLVALMLFVCIAVPLGLAWRLWRLDEPTFPGWMLVLADTAIFAALIMLLGRWDIAGLWTRAIVLGILVAAAIASLRRYLRRPRRLDGGPPLWRGHGQTLASAALFGSALVYVLVGIAGRHDPHPLAFPLRDGRFVVAQGGGIGLLNHHSGHRAQRHALDITAVNAAGFRAGGLLPEDPARYAIFGKAVVSPCEGTVITAQDGLPDMAPPLRDRNNPAGNHVVLACGGIQVELAHLRRGSVAVEAGQNVAAGARLGAVGNSGNTTEPHLHIHAVDPRTGAGLQMSFGGTVPVRNTMFSR